MWLPTSLSLLRLDNHTASSDKQRHVGSSCNFPLLVHSSLFPALGPGSSGATQDILPIVVPSAPSFTSPATSSKMVSAFLHPRFGEQLAHLHVGDANRWLII